jgi:hypothetical protein
MAIETARKYANGKATKHELAAAADDADAAYSAAASSAAASSSAYLAAGDAAAADERNWQTNRLFDLLGEGL